MSLLFPLSHVTMMTKEPRSGGDVITQRRGDSYCGDSYALSVFYVSGFTRRVAGAPLLTCITMPSTGVLWWHSFPLAKSNRCTAPPVTDDVQKLRKTVDLIKAIL